MARAHVIVVFPSEQAAQRAMYLVQRDLCRVRGAILMAEERLEVLETTGKLPGSQRRAARQTIESAPDQANVLGEAYEAFQAGLKQARDEGRIG